VVHRLLEPLAAAAHLVASAVRAAVVTATQAVLVQQAQQIQVAAAAAEI
jgi:hypothetical protein